MIPIYEQGSGRGIGHGLDSFLERFEEICHEYQLGDRTKSFAFIFYDFTDTAIRRILKDQGAFARLDRLSRSALSIFYLHAGNRENVKRFNSTFMEKIGLDDDIKPPCVVFFKLSDGDFTDISVATLSSTDLIHGLNELYEVVELYKKNGNHFPACGLKSIRWVKSATKFVSIEVGRAAIKAVLGHLPF